MAAGSPSLGMNVAFNPFGSAYQPRQKEQVQQKRTDGFSDDGLSYSVINDFDKLAAQALADYEARVKSPRIDIWGRTLPEDTPQGLDRELFQPLRTLFGGNSYSDSPALRTYKTGTGDIVGINPRTGESGIVFDAPEPPAKPQREAEFPMYTELNSTLQPSGLKMLTMPQIGAILPSLPDTLRTNATAQKYQGWLNSSNAAPKQAQSNPHVFVGAPNTNTGTPLRVLNIGPAKSRK